MGSISDRWGKNEKGIYVTVVCPKCDKAMELYNPKGVIEEATCDKVGCNVKFIANLANGQTKI